VFQGHCAVCHTVRGASFFAEGTLGPDLTHVMSRRTIGAGLVPNNIGHLAAWIANAQALKPGADMPTMNLTSQQLVDVVSYVNSLR
jgi:cytochrome c oxidase subunit 2